MKKTYLVTERAGDWIAGQRKPKDGKITLSDSQAAYELALGTIELAPPDTGPEPKKQRRKAGK
ncbi:hypothetical protein [Brucella anthropi]|uniref:hypothetical protein n=1 Tax=Brucella anthropi TaxID=529 RepID=UPI002166BEB1|nr:hypothetical protein [Brucella anthropi]UVV66761.1 hypothetical protein NW321_09755 [Brucella anthropi]